MNWVNSQLFINPTQTLKLKLEILSLNNLTSKITLMGNLVALRNAMNMK